MILNLMPDAPEGYLGYEVAQISHMWWGVWLLHPPYSYKEGVRTIWGFVKSNGKVYSPATATKPSKTIVCDTMELYKQNPYTLIVPKGGYFSHSLLDLL